MRYNYYRKRIWRFISFLKNKVEKKKLRPSVMFFSPLFKRWVKYKRKLPLLQPYIFHKIFDQIDKIKHTAQFTNFYKEHLIHFLSEQDFNKAFLFILKQRSYLISRRQIKSYKKKRWIKKLQPNKALHHFFTYLNFFLFFLLLILKML